MNLYTNEVLSPSLMDEFQVQHCPMLGPPGNPIKLDEAAWRERIRTTVPLKAPFACLDWEHEHTEEFNEQAAFAIYVARRERPYTKWGWYLTSTRFWPNDAQATGRRTPEWRKEALALDDLYQEFDFLLLPLPRHLAVDDPEYAMWKPRDLDLEYWRDNVKLALELGYRAKKPVWLNCNLRIHESAPMGTALRLIPPEELYRQVKFCLDIRWRRWPWQQKRKLMVVNCWHAEYWQRNAAQSDEFLATKDPVYMQHALLFRAISKGEPDTETWQREGFKAIRSAMLA